MKWIILIILISFSKPIMMLEEEYTSGVGKGIGGEIKAPTEKPRSIEVDEEELHCLTLTLFKEIRGESERVAIVTAQTILNRLDHKAFPDSVCKVIKQKIKNTCQFSWWCKKDRLVVNDIKSYTRLNEIAYNALLGKYEGMSTSTYFKLCKAESKFFDKLEFRGKIGSTCFYREWR